jgi:LysR family glycine cleavage system transcriptional activator
MAMSSRLPPFGALRLLEAAARRRSYSLAGAELNVTHSAISQQIRRLEEDLGRKLFERRGLMMEPTSEALELAQAYASAHAIVERGWRGLMQPAKPSSLVVSMVASFARTWFAPRLPGLRQALPDLELEVRTSRSFASFDDGGVDAAIRVSRQPWPDLEVQHLFDDVLFPVASPAFIERHRLRTPADLLGAQLLLEHDTSWTPWFEAAGVCLLNPLSGYIFDDAAVLLDAAMDGLGVALTRPPLAQGALKEGRLVRLFDLSVPSGLSVDLVWKQSPKKDRDIGRFRDWMMGEIGVGVVG